MKERKERGEPEEEEIVSPLDWIGVGSSAASTIAQSASPAPTYVRDLVTGEGQGGKTKQELEVSVHSRMCIYLGAKSTPQTTQAVLPGSSQQSPPESGRHQRDESEPESSKHEKWEELSSDVGSSYPSLSYPSDPHSPSSQHNPQLHHSHHDSHSHHPHHHDHAHEESSPTFAIFDTRLSRKTRALALFSSLAINLFLPFVNGVMLGFGEIFARNVVGGWFGWKTPARPGSVAASAGLGRDREKRQ